VGRPDFFFGLLLQRRFDAIGHGLERRDAHGPLLTRFQQTRDQLLPLEALAGAVFLHDHVRDLVDPLVAREALAAIEAFTPPADDLAFLALARVDDFVAEMSTVRALHATGPLPFSRLAGPHLRLRHFARSRSVAAAGASSAAASAIRRIPDMFNPACAANSSPSTSEGVIDIACSTNAAATAASFDTPKNVVVPRRNAAWNPPIAPGVGTAT